MRLSALWLLALAAVLFVCCVYANKQRAVNLRRLKKMRAQYKRRQISSAINNCRRMTAEQLKNNVAAVTSGWLHLPPKWREYCVSKLRDKLGRVRRTERPQCTRALRRMKVPCNPMRRRSDDCFDHGSAQECLELSLDGVCMLHEVWYKCRKTCGICLSAVAGAGGAGATIGDIPQPPNCPEELELPIAGSECGWGAPAEMATTEGAAVAMPGGAGIGPEPTMAAVLPVDQLTEPSARLLACGSRLVKHVERTCGAVSRRPDLCDNLDYSEHGDVVDKCCKEHCRQKYIIFLCCIMDMI